MLVGEPPFNGETAVSIAIKHIQDSIPNITTDKREEVPQSLSNVVLRATEKDKHNRYHTVQEMCDDLTSALHENRANEEKYELDKTKTVPLTKDELNKKMNSTHNDDDLNKTMQIPIVNEPVRQQEFQSLEGRYSPPPKKKHSKMKIIVLSLIFALLLAGLVGFIGMGVFGSKYEEMPDLSGKTEKEAEQILKDHHLTMGDISRKYSDKYPESQIIKSEPNSGERVEEGEAIDIILSKGPQKVKMPNLVGLPKDEAVKKLKDLGLKDIDVEQAYSRSVDKGLISEQSVEANSEVALNDHHIKIYESLGVRQVYVSDFENKSYSSAKKELESKGFRVQATQENDDKVKKGNIISQSPKNKSVDEGSVINLTVSKGKSGEGDDDTDDSDVKTTTETVKVPYSGSKGKSQTVEVFIRDKDNTGNSASQTYKISKDKTISIPLKIEKGKTAGYTVRVDNKIVADKDVGYDD